MKAIHEYFCSIGPVESSFVGHIVVACNAVDCLVYETARETKERGRRKNGQTLPDMNICRGTNAEMDTAADPSADAE